jgi:hypothetical protein
MYGWLQRGDAFLGVVSWEGKRIGFEYYSVYKGNVYGISAANDPDYDRDHPVRHVLEWQAMLWMKKQGFGYYEIGEQHIGATLHDIPDKKLMDISHFKKGFGGSAAPLFCGERFYDRDHFLKTYAERLRKFSETIN